MPLFLHTADWQIGRQFATFGAEHGPILAEARIAAVERIAAVAAEHQVDAVFVAGDVFDAQTVSERTVRRLFHAMAGFTGPWLLLPGNHDAALAESVWTRAQRMGAVPGNAHLLLSPEVLLLPSAGIAVLPAPLTQRHTFSDLTAWFDGADTPTDLLRIGLAHGGVEGILAEDIDATNPIAPTRAHTARLDYLALGDWHGSKCIDARTWYAGTPEPDRFKDNGAGQALLVRIAAPGAEPVVTPLPVGLYRWHKLQHEIAVASDVQALITQWENLGPRDVVDLRISGRVDLAGRQQLQDALRRLDGRVRCLLEDSGALRMVPTDEDIAQLQADGYLGEVIAELRDAQQLPDGDEARTAQDALALLASVLHARRAAVPAALPAAVPAALPAAPAAAGAGT